MLAQDNECHIVNTTSVAGINPYHPGSFYQISKHAAVALSENLYNDLGNRGSKIKISVLCPGFVRTRIFSSTRNMPAGVAANSSIETMPLEAEENMWNFLESKQYRVISPEQVADIVFTAIREEKFYILTHPEFLPMAKERMKDILEGRNPTLQDLRFDK
jgi:short-subunit dehydrogenase